MLNQSAKRNRFLASVTNSVGKQKFICLIGGRVCNPRQQHALTISRHLQHTAAAAGYKPAPQLGRQTAFYRCEFVKK